MTAETPNLELLAIYEKEKARLMAEGSTGKFALVGDGKIVGVWETYEDALQSGYERFGVDAKFLVKKIQGPIDGILFFSRDLNACQV